MLLPPQDLGRDGFESRRVAFAGKESDCAFGMAKDAVKFGPARMNLAGKS